MSKIARWSYKAVATVRPYEGMDYRTGEITYGEEYTILCTWEANTEQARDNDGAEFVGRHIVYHEDPRPKYLDQIKLTGHTEWEQIRSVTVYDMAMFGDLPDYRMVTA